MRLSRRARDQHILKELAYGLNQMHSMAARMRADADSIDALADMLQPKLDTIAHDIMGVNNNGYGTE